MGRFRARTLCATLAVAGGLVLSLRGQTPDEPRFVVLQGVGLPAIDEGLIADDSHTPHSLETRRRLALGASLSQDRTSATGARYRPGRLIV